METSTISNMISGLALLILGVWALTLLIRHLVRTRRLEKAQKAFNGALDAGHRLAVVANTQEYLKTLLMLGRMGIPTDFGPNLAIWQGTNAAARQLRDVNPKVLLMKLELSEEPASRATVNRALEFIVFVHTQFPSTEIIVFTNEQTEYATGAAKNLGAQVFSTDEKGLRDMQQAILESLTA